MTKEHSAIKKCEQLQCNVEALVYLH